MSETPTGNVLSQSEVFNLDQLAVRIMPNSGKSWDVLHVKLATGEMIAVHESTQPLDFRPTLRIR